MYASTILSYFLQNTQRRIVDTRVSKPRARRLKHACWRAVSFAIEAKGSTSRTKSANPVYGYIYGPGRTNKMTGIALSTLYRR
ncbi:hypothetical protein RSAG8_05056, partial [Rhizoctonia solani AG-8 WAC10335]